MKKAASGLWLPENLAQLSMPEAKELACQMHPGAMAELKLGFTNALFHWEWYELEMKHNRLAIVAPREHAKSEVFSVVSTAWMAIYRPGSWQAIFTSSSDNAIKLMERILSTIGTLDPVLLDNAPKMSGNEVILSNWSRITVSGAGKAIRGWHPDRIVGDDLLSDIHATTNLHRRRMETWWFGTVGPMAHPGTTRKMGWGRIKRGSRMQQFKPTKIVLVGTPFHQLDLLMAMRENPIYVFRRYTAEFVPDELVPGTMAVEATDIMRRAA